MDYHINFGSTHRTSTRPPPGASYVPDEPVVTRHRSNFDGVGEAPVGRHERRLAAVQREDRLPGHQVIEADRPLFLSHHQLKTRIT